MNYRLFSATRLIASVALIAGLALPSSAFAASPAPAIELYSASYCGECARVKAYLKEKRIAYVNHDIENDIDKRREFYARGGVAIPFLIVNGQKMHGFDPERLEALRAGR